MEINTSKKITQIIADFKNHALPIIKELVEKSKKLAETCDEINCSWSGSFAGNHGLFYFKNFEEPKHEERFSGEWGFINGVPDGWEKRNTEEVKREIEKRVSIENFSIDKTEKEALQLKEEAKDILNEIVIIFSAIDLSKMEEEDELLSKIKKFKFGKDKGYFIKNMLPRTIMTRDTEAMMQGICRPTHTYYLGVAQAIIDMCNSIEEFITLSSRTIRQIETKEKYLFKNTKNKWNWINPFWLLWKLFLFFNQLLKWIWRHKIISVILIVLSLLAFDYSLILINLKTIWKGLANFYL